MFVVITFTGTVYFNHTHGCMKCTANGEYYKNESHMSFKNFYAPKRTDESFRQRTDPDHHKEKSPLENIIGLNMVEDFVVADSLHLFDEGIMKKNLMTWINGDKNDDKKKIMKWRASDITNVSGMIVGLNASKPVELHRSFRKLDCIRYWKALEFKYFLVYLGPVVLRDVLPKDVYEHILLLFVAVTICSCEIYDEYLDQAGNMFQEYIELYTVLHGDHSISSNVHNVGHIIDDVKKFGILQRISSYPFENLLFKIKNLLRSGHKPLAQVAKRLSEISAAEICQNRLKEFPLLSHENKNETHPLTNCSKIFNKIDIAESITFQNNEKNKWFLTKDNQVVEFVNATYVGEEIHLCGRSLRGLYNFFEHPCNSSHINIYASLGKQNESTLFKLSDVKCKMFSMKKNSETVCIPLHHTLDFFRNFS